MKRFSYPAASLAYSLAGGAYVVLALTLELASTKVVITGLAVLTVTYFAVLMRDDWELAVKQQRTILPLQRSLQIAIASSCVGMGLFTLGIAISFIPAQWASVTAYSLLLATDAVVVVAGTLLVAVRGGIVRPMANIAQHEFAVVGTGSSSKPVLRTRNVRWCTTWYGWDSEHRVAFMAHFDRPASARVIAPMIDEILLHVPPGTRIQSVVEGGYRTWLFGWPLLSVFSLSYNTRKTLKAAISNDSRLTIDIRDGAYTLDWARPRFKVGHPPHHGRLSRDISLHTSCHDVSHELLAGDKLPNQPFLFKPMLRSDKIE